MGYILPNGTLVRIMEPAGQPPLRLLSQIKMEVQLIPLLGDPHSHQKDWIVYPESNLLEYTLIWSYNHD